MKYNKKIKNSESEWFEKLIRKTTNCVYLPVEISTTFTIKKNDKFAVFLKKEEFNMIFPSRVSIRRINNEYYYGLHIPFEYFETIDKGRRYMVKILKLDKINNYNPEFKGNFINIPNLILRNTNDFSVTNWINKKEIVIWHENIRKEGRPQVPLIIPKAVGLDSELAKYLGLYFADGHKTQYFRVYASSKKLANSILPVYRNLIRNGNLTLNVLFTKLKSDKRNNEAIINYLNNYWKEFVNKKSIKILPNKTKLPEKVSKHSEVGILKIQDSRLLPLLIHKLLIEQICNLMPQNKELALKFFEGAADGDVYVFDTPNHSFRYFQIATNETEVKVWRKLCKILNLKSFEYKRDGTAIVMHVGDYYNACLMFSSGIFENYDKRRVRLFNSLRNRIETKIFKRLARKGCTDFSPKFSRYFGINKNSDLIKYKLITISDNKIILTNSGTNFLSTLTKTNILEED